MTTGAPGPQADAPTCEGIDVSSNQPRIDWDRVASVGITFAYFRVNVGEGGADPSFRLHATGARDAGILGGGYHFAQPDEDAEDDVDAFAKACGSTYLALPPALDLEIRNDRSVDQVIDFAEQWAAYCVEIVGKRPIIYTGPYFWKGLGPRVLDEKWLSFDLWVSNYGRATPIVPAPWATWRIWQYAANRIVLTTDGRHVYGVEAANALSDDPGARVIADPGLVGGVPGECDRDRFNGTYTELRAWAGLGPATAGEDAGSK